MLVIIKSCTFFDKAEFCLTEYEQRLGQTQADQHCHAKQCMKGEEPDGEAGDRATAVSQLLDRFQLLFKFADMPVWSTACKFIYWFLSPVLYRLKRQKELSLKRQKEDGEAGKVNKTAHLTLFTTVFTTV